MVAGTYGRFTGLSTHLAVFSQLTRQRCPIHSIVQWLFKPFDLFKVCKGRLKITSSNDTGAGFA